MFWKVTAVLVAVVVAWFVARSRRGLGERRALPREPRSHVTFSGGEEHVTDDERTTAEADGLTELGGGLLLALSKAMKARGLAVAPPTAEDTGWCADVTIGQVAYRLRFGCLELDPARWLLFVEPSTPRVVAEDDPELTRLVLGVDAALRSLPSVAAVRWHGAHDWEAGREDAGRERPTL